MAHCPAGPDNAINRDLGGVGRSYLSGAVFEPRLAYLADAPIRIFALGHVILPGSLKAPDSRSFEMDKIIQGLGCCE